GGGAASGACRGPAGPGRRRVAGAVGGGGRVVRQAGRPVRPGRRGAWVLRGSEGGGRVKITVFHPECGREVLVQQILASQGHCPWDGKPFSVDYTAGLGEALA